VSKADADGGALTRWDFFISYTSADREWAEWVAWTLEDAGYTVLVQAWEWPASPQQVELATSTLGPGSLSRALEDERMATSAYLINYQNVVDLPNEDLQNQANPATDEALASLDVLAIPATARLVAGAKHANSLR
jgi:hypothetical protein